MWKQPVRRLAAVVALAGSTLAFAASDGRSYVTGYFALELEHVAVSSVVQIEGGSVKGEVVEEFLGNARFPDKHLATVRITPLELRSTLPPSPALVEWISSWLSGQPALRSGAVLATEERAVGSREFQDALLTEIGFPAWDGNDRTPASMVLTAQPRGIRYVPGGKGRGDLPAVQGKASPTGFRLEIGDLPCARVSRVESLTIKQSVSGDGVGPPRDPVVEPVRLEVSNLVLQLPQADAQPWYDYFEDFVIHGNAGNENELDGSLSYLGPDGAEELLVVELHHVGIVGLEPVEGTPTDPVRRIRVELYVEQVQLGEAR